MHAPTASPVLFVVPALLFAASLLPAQGGSGGGSSSPPANASVAFRSDSRLVVSRADATGQTAIGTLPVGWAPMAWAPNGGSIYFQDDASTGIYRILPNGTGQSLAVAIPTHRYTGVGVTRGQPCPDGQHRIFFPVGTSDEELWSARLDGSDVRNHGVGFWWAPNEASSLGHPSVSTAGDKVLVVADLFDPVVLSLGLVGGQLAITARQSLIAADPNHPLYGAVIWSAWFEAVSPRNPNGTSIVLVAEPNYPSAGHIYRLDLTQPAVVQQLPVPQTSLYSVTSSDDGNYLFYAASNTRNGVSIFRANWDGTGVVDWSQPAKRKVHLWPCLKP